MHSDNAFNNGLFLFYIQKYVNIMLVKTIPSVKAGPDSAMQSVSRMEYGNIKFQWPRI